MRDALRDLPEILVHVLLAGMVLLHPLMALYVVLAVGAVVLIVFSLMFHLLGSPSDMNDHSD